MKNVRVRMGGNRGRSTKGVQEHGQNFKLPPSKPCTEFPGALHPGRSAGDGPQGLAALPSPPFLLPVPASSHPALFQKWRCGGIFDLSLSVILSLVWAIFHSKHLSNDFWPPFPVSSPRVCFLVGHHGKTSSTSLEGLSDFNLLSIISTLTFLLEKLS